ncbi:Thioredoxin-like protein [Zalerion maritima]|uniref:Thioredoxin-like protein n=1 Tax=Zalerion maritima TaxID=339359 RepID=A0AAD5RH85_9PEZI|nr:Thioredoxin-like protein [Zalerion maritima]
MAVHITSSGQWEKMLANHAVVIADYWCGPCKMIAPTFENLATKFAKPSKIAFAKINTDTQGDISARYAVRAMPTFKILHYGTVKETVQGASPSALNSAVEKAVKLAGPGPGPGAAAGGASSFGGAGRKLGGNPVSAPPRSVAGRPVGGGPAGGGAAWYSPARFFRLIRAFVGLYFVSLFSLDPYKAAEASAFNVNGGREETPRTVGGEAARGGASGPGGKPGAPGAGEKPRIQTLADL